MIRKRSKTAAVRRKPAARAKAQANDADHPLKIGEAARIVGVEAYVLRFWETQFPFLRPHHSRSKHRYYDQKTIDTLKLVKRLLHDEGFTIAGAKKHIRGQGLERLRAADAQSPAAPASAEHGAAGEIPRSIENKLTAIRDDLKSLHRLLED